MYVEVDNVAAWTEKLRRRQVSSTLWSLTGVLELRNRRSWGHEQEVFE